MKTTEIITLFATILVAGWFSAFIVQALKRLTWPSSVKLILSGIIALLVALAASWISGDLTNFVKLWNNGMTANEVVAYFTLVFTSAATWYRFYMKDAAWAQNLGNWPGGKPSE